jgi:hypothetical protein
MRMEEFELRVIHNTVERIVEAISKEAKGSFDKQRMTSFIYEMLPQLQKLDKLWIFWFSELEDAEKDWLPTILKVLKNA